MGGLDSLEKQLQMRLNLNENSPVVSKTTTTTISPISQSLYNKVVGTKRGTLRTQKVINSGGGSSTAGSEIEPLVQRQNKENRYSSVIRNSRPRPQNDGIDQLSEVEGGGIIREKPQYTTITRTHAPKTQNSNDDDDSDSEPTNATSLDQTDESTVTHQPTYQYVNIQRPRVSTTPSPAEANDGNEDGNSDNDDDEDEDEETSEVQPTTTSKMHYVNIQRVRPTKPQYLVDEIESEAPVTETK